MSFEELEHTADVRMRVVAGTLEDLFSEAARALMQVMYGLPGSDGIARSITLEADDIEDLMHAFLSELLFICEVEEMVIAGADIRISDTGLYGVVRGESFSPEKHRKGREVKGISLSGLRISREQESYILDVLFDV